MKAFWKFLSDPTNQRTLGVLGGGLGVVVGAAWAVFVYLYPPQSVGAEDIRFSDDKYVAMALAFMEQAQVRYEENVATARGEIAAEAAAKNHKVELEQLNSLLGDKDKAIATLKETLAAASAVVTRGPEGFTRSEIEAANREIRDGNIGEATRLLEQVAARGTSEAARAEFLLGKLAEEQVDLARAARQFRRAVQIDPDNAEFRDYENSLYSVTVVYDSGMKDQAEKIATALFEAGLSVATDPWTRYRESSDGAMQRWVDRATFLYSSQTDRSKITEFEQTIAAAGLALGADHRNGLNKHGTTWSFGLFAIFLWLPVPS